MKRVLVAPLDWGLGHAARCVPIIQNLLNRQCKVFLAGSGNSLLLLKAEFPFLPSFTLPAYDPQYPLTGSMVWKMVKQLPKFFRVIQAEHRIAEQLVLNENIDFIISH